MDAYKIAAKLFADMPEAHPAPFVPIFHRWIQAQNFPGHLLIDVADYAHVHGGPGTVLVGAEANIHMDREDNRRGMTYIRKLPLQGDFRQRLATVMGDLLRAAARMENEDLLSGKLKFRTNEIVIKINDRLLAPPTPESFAAVKDDLQAVAKQLFGSSGFTLEEHLSPQTLFEVRIKSSDSPGIAAMQQRLGASA